MSDHEIFLFGLLASLLMAIHLVVNIVQFRKLGREIDRDRREARREQEPGTDSPFRP